MENKKKSVWEIIAIIGTVVLGICAVVAVAIKLYSKFCLLNEPLNVDDAADDDAEQNDDEEQAEAPAEQA
ncbi:MAG: hypothetical protein IJR83_04730 [Clostridia bacterium]|nr:hypothetical protein [Clostridia bacterium]